MIPIIYEKTETAFTSNGLGRLRDALDVKVTEERNGVYELTAVVPVDGAGYDLLKPGRYIAATHDDNGGVQPFYIVGWSRPINGLVEVHAVHVSYKLTGQTVWATGVNSLTAAFNLFRNVSGTPFQYVQTFTASGYMAAADGVPRTVRQMIGGVEGSVLDTYGGELEWNRWSVILHKSRGTARELVIRYGVNLLDYQEETDYLETYTSCVPFWVGMDGVNNVVVRGSRVDSGAASYSGTRIVVPLDLTDKFEEKPTAAQLESMAATVMRSRSPALPSQNITVDFFRLQETPEFADLADLLTCRLCDTVNVVFPRYNMAGRFKIVKVVWDVLREKYSSMELGSLSTSLAEALGISNTAENLNTTQDLNVAGDLAVGGTITSAGAITAGGKITAGGRLVLPYNTYFAAKDSGGTEQGMAYFYNNGEYFGNNSFPTTIRGSSISISNPITGFYKITQVTVSVPALSAHANVAASSHSMTAQSGFHAVGIMGWSSGSYRIRPTTHYIASDTSLYAGFANTSAGATSQAFNVVFYVLWLKATSA